MIRTAALAAAASTVVLTIASPAQAEAHRTTERVFFTADADTCWTTPDASTTGKAAPVRPVLGALYKATPAQYDGVGVGRGADTFRWIEIASGAGCYVTADETSEAVPNDLDPSGWKGSAIVAPGARGMSWGGVLNAGDKTLHAAPSAASKSLAEVAEGDVLITPGWSIDGGSPSVKGRKVWAPVVYSGVVAWIPASTLAPIPTYTIADLISTITSKHPVTVREQPSATAEPLGEVAAGVTAPALQTPTVGWIPVAIDSRVGWVAETDLLADPSAAPAAAPTASPNGGAVDGALAKWEAAAKGGHAHWKAKRQAEKTSGKPGLFRRVRGTAEKVVARTRLWPAAIAAALALILAGIGHRGSVALRDGSLATRVARRVAPGLVPILVHGALPAAIGAGLWAAWIAPTSQFQPLVLSAASITGAVLGCATAHRVAAMRGANRVNALIRDRAAPLLLGAAAICAIAHGFLGWDLAACVVVGLTGAGAAAGRAAASSEVEPVCPEEVAR